MTLICRRITHIITINIIIIVVFIVIIFIDISYFYTDIGAKHIGLQRRTTN